MIRPTTPATGAATGVGEPASSSFSASSTDYRGVADQLVQLSVAGLVVAVAAPPVAVTPVSDGIEKYVLTQAAGAAAVMLASFVKVTVKGLLACPLALTVRALLRVWELSLVDVE